MDWANTHLEFSQRNKAVFSYRQRPSLVVKKTISNGDVLDKFEVTKDEDWEQWCQRDQSPDGGLHAPGIEAFLATRPPDTVADDKGDGMGGNVKGHDPQILRGLPCSKAVFNGIIDRFFIHGSITQAIQRAGPIFSRTYLNIGNPPEPAIVYVCRTASSWPGDMALSATHFPNSCFTYATFFGCEFDTKPRNAGVRVSATTLKSGDRIKGLLSNSGDAVAHPMLLPGILAEIELRRHMSIVELAVMNLLNTVTNVSAGEGADYRAFAPGPGEEDNHAIKPWLEMHIIKIKLESWQRELRKMVHHVEELSQTRYLKSHVPCKGDTNDRTGQPYTDEEIMACEAKAATQASLKATGDRIKERLEDIIDQYHEKISESTLTMEGLTLATQVAHTRANMEVALETKKDGGQMKSIAVLTMVFLPGTFFATFFSMSFFKWDPPEGDVVSRKIWIYVLITVIFTGLTLLIYTWWSRRQSQNVARENDLEQGLSTDGIELPFMKRRAK